MIAKIFINDTERNQNGTITTFAGAAAQALVYVNHALSMAGGDGLNHLLIEQVGRRLELIKAANDQTMAQIAACDQGDAAVDGGSSLLEDAAKPEMLLVILHSEAEPHDRAAPAGFV